MRCKTANTLTILLLVLLPMTIKAQEQEDSRLYWRAGVSVSLSTYMQNCYGGEGPTYDVSLSERYGKYHGPVYSIPPLSFDVNYQVFKFLEVSAGLSWIPMWGKVYATYDAADGNTVFANSFFAIPSIRINYIHRNGKSLYSSVGFGIGIHFNRSDSEIFGTDHWWYHNDYILDKGNNCITKQLELVLLGFNYKHFFWEGGFGSKFWGYGSRFGVMFSF